MGTKGRMANYILLLLLLIAPFSTLAQDHINVRPMPADRMTPIILQEVVHSDSGLQVSGQKGKFSYQALPYPALMGGVEGRVSGRGDMESFYNFGGGAGFRVGYDSLLLLSFDGLAFSEQGPNYWDEALGADDISPSFGPRDGHLVSRLSGQFQIRPSEHFTIRAGRGQHFFGKGYRSLLLSHHSDVYPYLRIDSEFGRFRYVNLYTKMEHLPVHSFGPSAENKYGAFHYLSFEASDRWTLGFFESVLWQARDTMNPRGFDANYLNPVVFYRPLEYAQGSADRMLMGLDVSYEAFPGFTLYAQGMLDEFLLEEIREGRGWWGNKYGLQAGLHWDVLFGAEPLSVRWEYNTVRPYSYSHGSAVQSYSHRGRPLAHPLGANFDEFLGILCWEKDDWRVRAQYIAAFYGADPGGSPQIDHGQDLFKPYQLRQQEYGNRTGQGERRELYFLELEASKRLDEASGLRAGAGLTMRKHEAPTSYPGINLQNFQGYFRVFLRSSLFPRVRRF